MANCVSWAELEIKDMSYSFNQGAVILKLAMQQRTKQQTTTIVSPRGVSSKMDFAFRLAPFATNSSTIWIYGAKIQTL